ncbi:unnamed protein product, partial [Mesorhabditis spiculigera]
MAFYGSPDYELASMSSDSLLPQRNQVFVNGDSKAVGDPLAEFEIELKRRRDLRLGRRKNEAMDSKDDKRISRGHSSNSLTNNTLRSNASTTRRRSRSRKRTRTPSPRREHQRRQPERAKTEARRQEKSVERRTHPVASSSQGPSRIVEKGQCEDTRWPCIECAQLHQPGEAHNMLRLRNMVTVAPILEKQLSVTRLPASQGDYVQFRTVNDLNGLMGVMLGYTPTLDRVLNTGQIVSLTVEEFTIVTLDHSKDPSRLEFIQALMKMKARQLSAIQTTPIRALPSGSEASHKEFTRYKVKNGTEWNGSLEMFPHSADFDESQIVQLDAEAAPTRRIVQKSSRGEGLMIRIPNSHNPEMSELDRKERELMARIAALDQQLGLRRFKI